MSSSPKLKASLPPGLIVRLGKTVWHTLWQVMMARLAPSDKSGAYTRPESGFRSMIAPDSPYSPATGRYCLIVGMGCPWAHRTLVTQALKGLENVIPLWRVSPSPNEGIWLFDNPGLGWRSLPELYQTAQPGYSGRSTVPVLWDTQTRTIVNNESADIIKILNEGFDEYAAHPELDLYPEDLREQIEAWNRRIYPAINNGVYRTGFAQSQAAYESACTALFTALDDIDAHLKGHRYLCGDRLTLADVRLFTTLFRFDAVYYSLFKCDRHRICDYPQLWPYARDIYQQPGVARTCDLAAIRADYFGNLFPLNPGGIIPLGADPKIWSEPCDRASLSQELPLTAS
ncbi:glutathione S-transferase C-terminal domain-containing protein [Oscillatoria sp. CS-180]|uniref:glutathione S-transferase family protein n=1 Tax=Oscillatoria sp. CS-180 TaxID=3021720 RepID=UPI00232F5381|nr:glutathione S-transferase C-terminal domain-containing protein [Oscillatoria sp. CS-180]MDB9527979.1 glutathione S-transferase C-terminal domain-containing protein [Oscillatoria sp. CS-180]